MLKKLATCFRGELDQLTIQEPARAVHPDSLDLVAMARGGLNYLRGNPDPQRDYECKFALGPLGIPCHYPEWVRPNEYGYDPIALGDTDCRMDWQYAHMREIVGVPEADDVERGVRRRILNYQGPDHLSWTNPASWTGMPVEGKWISTWTSGKVMVSLAETWRRTGERAAKDEARQIFLALRGLAHWQGNRAYYPKGMTPYREGKWLDDVGWGVTASRNYSPLATHCLLYYQMTGDEEALAFAKSFTDGLLAGLQDNMGNFMIDPDTGAFGGHVHLHTHAIWGVAMLGVLLNEPQYSRWARNAFEFVRSRGTDYGWCPEWLPQAEYRTEICVVGDMVSTAVWLAKAGEPHYWDHLDRFVRNQLRRSQFFMTPAFLDLFNRLHHDQSPQVMQQALAELKKIEGGFVAQSLFDDWVGYPSENMGQPGIATNGIHMMGCCPPEGMRGIWEAWQNAVEKTAEGIFVNLCMNRDHPLARVTAYRPEEGGMQVDTRGPGIYFLRPPAWAGHHDVRLTRNGQSVTGQWSGPAGAYLRCDQVSSGETLELRWPVPHFRQTCSTDCVPQRTPKIVVHWAGQQVKKVEPAGVYLPMFQA